MTTRSLIHSITDHVNLLKGVIYFAMAFVACVVISMAYYSSFASSIHPMPILQDGTKLELEKVLASACMDNKTVFLTTLNKAWIEKDSIFDLYLSSFKYGIDTEWMLKHLIVICIDEEAYEHCRNTTTLYCYYFEIEGVGIANAANFMTPNYIEIVIRRNEILQDALHLGYNVFFTDADIVWFRNPFHHFHPDADFQLSSDHYAGDPFSTDNHANTGMLYIKSTPLTIDFLNLWQRARQFYPGLHSQEVFNKVKNCPVMRERGLRIKYISTEYFGGICEPSRNMSSVCTMHANCCVGLENKSCYLKSVLEDWKNYLALPPAVRESNPPSWSLSGC